MSTPSEHLAFQWAELNRLNEELGMMRRWGVLETDPGFKALWSARGAAMGKLGLLKPRTTTLIKVSAGLSPGEIKLWADAEMGWMVEARAKPGASPVYKYVSDEVARLLMTDKLTHELELELMTPDEYIGE